MRSIDHFFLLLHPLPTISLYVALCHTRFMSPLFFPSCFLLSRTPVHFFPCHSTRSDSSRMLSIPSHSIPFHTVFIFISSTCRATCLPCASARRRLWGRSFWVRGLRYERFRGISPLSIFARFQVFSYITLFFPMVCLKRAVPRLPQSRVEVARTNFVIRIPVPPSCSVQTSNVASNGWRTDF